MEVKQDWGDVIMFFLREQQSGQKGFEFVEVYEDPYWEG